MSNLTRKTYNFKERTMDALGQLLERGDNETDVVNRSVVLHAAVVEYMEDDTLTILTPTGEKVKLVLI